MKYGQALHQRSVPEWAPYNVDYNDLKYIIKANTSKDQAQAMAIPGHVDTALQTFENLFFTELWNQHDRVDLFVKSKADELGRRLRDHRKRLIALLARTNFESEQPVSMRSIEKFNKLEGRITSCGDEIKNLERFVTAQRIAFQKILKKYKKWTGSTTLGARFTDEVLSSPKSFTRRDFTSLDEQYKTLLGLLRDASTPFQSGPSTPQLLSREATQSDTTEVPEPDPAPQPKYWNEYDNGSEAEDENEPYTIYVNPDADTPFPGSETITRVIRLLHSATKSQRQKVKAWLDPESMTPERRPLFAARPGDGATSEEPGTDVEDDGSSTDFPTGYDTYYATFPSALPSISEQKMAQTRERVLFQSTIATFVAAFLLLAISALLVLTGRHRLRVEVDAGAIVGIVGSLLFGTLGFTAMLCRRQPLGYIHIACVSTTFLAICVLSGFLLVIVMGNSK